MLSEASGPEVAYSAIPAPIASVDLATMDDSILIAQSLAGSDMAFEALIKRYSHIVYGFFFSRTRNQNDAEDLGQEVFLTVYRSLPYLRSAERFGPWLMRIARHKFIDHCRRAKTSPAIVQMDDDDQKSQFINGVPDSAPNPARKAIASQTTAIILDQIERLPEKYRLVIYWRVAGEESAKEIALRLHLGEARVRMRIFRGLQILRKALARHPELKRKM